MRHVFLLNPAAGPRDQCDELRAERAFNMDGEISRPRLLEVEIVNKGLTFVVPTGS